MQKLELDQLFEAMYFNFENKQPHIFKNEILKQLKLDSYVDDDIHLLKYIAKQNKKTALFWLHPAPTSITHPKEITQIVELSDMLAVIWYFLIFSSHFNGGFVFLSLALFFFL